MELLILRMVTRGNSTWRLVIVGKNIVVLVEQFYVLEQHIDIDRRENQYSFINQAFKYKMRRVGAIKNRKQTLKVLKELDAFPKVPENYQETSASGGSGEYKLFRI